MAAAPVRRIFWIRWPPRRPQAILPVPTTAAEGTDCGIKDSGEGSFGIADGNEHGRRGKLIAAAWKEKSR